MNRRDFIKMACASALPFLTPARRGFAQASARGRAQHLLVLYAKGGLRSHAIFNAVGTRQHNPWGSQPAAPGTSWVLGAACGDADIVTPARTIGGFAKKTNRVAVLACVDHLPGSREVDADHRTASNRIGTGSPEGTMGLLTIIGRHHARYVNGFSIDAVPPVEIGTSEFGIGSGDLARYRPLSILPAEPAGGSEGAEGAEERTIRTGWNVAARTALDRRYLARKPSAYATRLENFVLAKQNAAAFAGLLRDPRLDLFGAPDAVDAGVTNRELLDILGRDPIMASEGPLPPWGPRIALALRLFGFGSPACVVTNDIFDMHDGERDGYAPRATDLVRQLAGLIDLLERMPHPSGGTYWDSTLVAVVSEFSRNNTSPATGFNSGNGSDHVEDDPGPCRNQAIALMGGIVRMPGGLIGSTNEEMNATGRVFGSRSLLATFLAALGVRQDVIGDPPIEELFS